MRVSTLTPSMSNKLPTLGQRVLGPTVRCESRNLIWRRGRTAMEERAVVRRPSRVTSVGHLVDRGVGTGRRILATVAITAMAAVAAAATV